MSHLTAPENPHACSAEAVLLVSVALLRQTVVAKLAFESDFAETPANAQATADMQAAVQELTEYIAALEKIAQFAALHTTLVPSDFPSLDGARLTKAMLAALGELAA